MKKIMNREQRKLMKMNIQFFAEKKNLKGLEEKRAKLAEDIQEILKAAKAEERAMTDEEVDKFTDLEKQIKAIDTTIAIEKRAIDLKVNVTTNEKHEKMTAEVEQRAFEEERAFDAFLRNKLEELRAGEIQLTQGNNGAVVPKTIAKRIIKAVRDMVPYLQLADVIPTGGTLAVPVYGEDATNYINADYVDEGTDLTDNIGKITSIDLNGYVIGALALISNKLLQNTDFDLTSFVVDRIAEAMVEKLEREFTVGTNNKITGVTTTTNVVLTASATSITYDELIETKHKLKKRFRKNAKWIMHPTTWTAICKLKDENGQPYFKEDEYKILGCEVLESDSMPTIAAGAKAVVFADLKGYTIKEAKSVEVQILREKFSTKNMIGILAFAEYDGKITDKKLICALQMKSA